ncbi:MAG TPA: 16S rRNA (cytosine(1402)-N(4))-methyltransferase RsmH [Gammaproteobacteria bacterium]|nr:16S rRNA (cytosine(1402)-N(4))-methyltransferase RsmH [Gammaproteobacteria bacterium]
MPRHEHQPVLLARVVEAMAIKPDGLYVDGTYGRGGHADAILAALGPDGRLYAIDRDPQAAAAARRRHGHDPRFRLVRGRFSELARRAGGCGLRGSMDGILLDLGVSSPQLDEGARGFSFLRDGPLDMRMNPERGESAADWLAHAGESEIARVLRECGEERHARRIARTIVSARAQRPLLRTGQLVALIERAAPSRERHRHPATRTFQALRIFINGELDELEAVLPQCLELLRARGRLVVISFHSLEDRIVKRFMRDRSRVDPALARLPSVPPEARPRLRVLGKAARASEDEVRANPRARSAVLRVAEKLA